MNTSDNSPLVSICCTTYNLEKYISEALDSFFMQKTEFDFEVIIGEDCSTDNTRSIIERYQLKYPGKIKIISDRENVGVIKNYIRVIEAAKGKYLAICDGDDYWSVADKLQKQVEFLESHPDYVICCHYSEMVDAGGKLLYVDPNPVPLEYSYDNVIRESRRETRNSTMLIRNCDKFRELVNQKWFLKCHVQDRVIKLFATYSTGKKIFVLPEVMGKYRIHNTSSWSTINSQVRKRKAREDFSTIIENFSYNQSQKANLRSIYFKRYFFHDIKNLNLFGSFKALKTLF